MVTFALDRLRRSGIVSFQDDGNRPPRHWSISNDLEALTLHDLSRAMGTNLDPLPGLHGRTNEEVIRDLAEREHMSQTQNLLSLFRDESSVQPVGEPMLAVTDVDYNFGEQDAFAASQAFEPVAQVVDRTTGDNGGPVQGDQSYVFVDAVLDEDLVVDVHSGPSALHDPDDGEELGAAVALDLTSAMRVASLDDEDEMFVPSATDDPSAPITVSAVVEERLDDDALTLREPAPLKLGDASPLAAVREEINHLLLGDELPQAQPVQPMKVWRRDAETALALARQRARPKPLLIPAGPAQAVEPSGSWKLSQIPLRRGRAEAASPSAMAQAQPEEATALPQNSEWLLPVTPKQAWRRDVADVEPVQSWKRGAG